MRSRAASDVGSAKLTLSTFCSAKKRSPSRGWRMGPVTVSPGRRLKRRTCAGDTSMAAARGGAARRRVPRPQVEAAHLRGRHVDVVRARLVVAVRAAQEAEAVAEQLQHALRVHLELLVRDARQQREDEVLLLQALV